MRISKASAEQIAIAILMPLEKQRDAALKIFESAAKEAYLQTVPDKVMEVYKKFPCWCQSATGLKLDGNGFDRLYVSVGRVPSTTEYNMSFKPSADTAKKLHVLERAFSDLKERYKKMLLDTETALLNLRTYKAIAEQIPEAIPFLPATESTAIILNLSGLRKNLKEIQAKK